jgi:hypothetical protein
LFSLFLQPSTGVSRPPTTRVPGRTGERIGVVVEIHALLDQLGAEPFDERERGAASGYRPDRCILML